MWCTLDEVDAEQGADLKSDQTWGWVHRNAEGWHTVGGYRLVESAGKLQPPTSMKSNLPTRAPDF